MRAIFKLRRGVGYTFRWMFCVQNFWWRRYGDDWRRLQYRKRCRCASHWNVVGKFFERGFFSFLRYFWFVIQIPCLLFQFWRGEGGCRRNGWGRFIGACAHVLLFLWRIWRWTSTHVRGLLHRLEVLIYCICGVQFIGCWNFDSLGPFHRRDIYWKNVYFAVTFTVWRSMFLHDDKKWK